MTCCHARTWAAWLVLAAGCHGTNVESPEGNDSAVDVSEAHVVVRVQAAEKRDIARTVTALGRCEALPDKMAVLTPAVEGRIGAILVEQGGHVTAGQPIVQLDLTLANAELAEKKAAQESTAASLRFLQSAPRPKEQEASKLAIDQAAIAVVRAEALVERLRSLAAKNEVSEQQKFEAEQALAQARLQRQSAQAQFDVLMLGPRPEAIAESQSKIKVDEESVALSQARLNLHTIRSPIDGILDSLTCRPGETISIGASIGVVVDSHQVLATAWLPVDRGQLIQVGQTAHVRVSIPTLASAAQSKSERSITGRIVFVGRVIDSQTGNMPVHVLVDNSRDELIVGQTVETSIVVEQPTAILSVPVAGIHDEGEGPAITVVRQGKAVVLKPELGIAEGGWVAVSGTDLKEGEPVIVQGAYNLTNGTKVKVQASEIDAGSHSE